MKKTLTPFGKAMKILRLSADISQREMAQELGITPSFLSNMELGRKKITQGWVEKISGYFEARGVPIPDDLNEMADATNGFVSLAGLSLEHQMLVSRLSRTQLTPLQVTELTELLDRVRARKSYVSDEAYEAAQQMANGLDQRDATIAALEIKLAELRAARDALRESMARLLENLPED